jgi:hypothetical protein
MSIGESETVREQRTDTCTVDCVMRVCSGMAMLLGLNSYLQYCRSRTNCSPNLNGRGSLMKMGRGELDGAPVPASSRARACMRTKKTTGKAGAADTAMDFCKKKKKKIRPWISATSDTSVLATSIRVSFYNYKSISSGATHFSVQICSIQSVWVGLRTPNSRPSVWLWGCSQRGCYPKKIDSKKKTLSL